VGGTAARRLSFWWVTLLSLVASSVGAWILVVISADAPSGPAVPWGLAAGLGAAVGATSLYRGYGHGQMAVAGPLSAVGAAALPAVVGVLLGDRLPWVGIVGIVLALPAIWLMSSSSGPTGHVRPGVGEGLLSGGGFALEFNGLERAGDAAGLLPVAVSQSTALVVVLVSLSAIRPPRSGGKRPQMLAGLAGLLSLTATGLYFFGVHAGMLTVAAVLASLYPGVTVVLAATLLHERPDRRQVAGLLLGAIAVTMVVLAD
jgi:drug/metabolite transporter (DMT)-like permease